MKPQPWDWRWIVLWVVVIICLVALTNWADSDRQVEVRVDYPHQHHKITPPKQHS